MRDVDPTAGEAVQTFAVIGLDFDIHSPHLGGGSPVAVKGAQLEGPPAIPLIEVVGARARRGLLRIEQRVWRQGQQREELTVDLRELNAQRLAVHNLNARERITRVAGSE